MKSFFLAILVSLFPLKVFATDDPKAAVSEIGAAPVLGSMVDMSLQFTGEDGVARPLRDFITPNKPFLLVPVYYRCPGLCGLTINETIRLVNLMTLVLGVDYSLITVSFNPTEKAELAKGKAQNVIEQLDNKDAARAGWKFLVGEQDQISTLLQQLNFRYVKDGDDFQHVSSVYVLSSEGKISQIFSGIDPSPWNAKLALVEASNGKVGNILHQALLACFHFDPKEGRYTFVAYNTVRTGGMFGLIGIIAMWIWLWRTKSRKAEAA